MRKMKSRVLAVLMAAGMIFTAQGMYWQELPVLVRQRLRPRPGDRER